MGSRRLIPRQSKNPYVFKLEDVENFVSVDVVEHKIRAMDWDLLKKDEQFLIEAFQWALEDRLRASESPQSPDP